jgi:hypothetical protein
MGEAAPVAAARGAGFGSGAGSAMNDGGGFSGVV